MNREQLTALAATALTGGLRLPAADEATITRAEAMVEKLTPGARRAYLLLWPALDARAVLLHGRRFTKLNFSRRLEVLNSLHTGEAERWLLRALLTPLKLAYFEDPRVFEALGCRYAVEPPVHDEPARWHAQVVDGATLPEGETLECDVVVVGTGAGGAPLAAELAGRGHAVLLLEEGAHHTRRHFDGRAPSAINRLYRERGFTVSWGNTVIPIPLGRGVGGTTLINSGTCLRASDDVLASWRAQGLRDFAPHVFSRWYEAVEQFLQVAPSSPAALGKPAELIARGCDTLGYSHHALPRNAPGCDGQGLCCFGCPTGAKRSTDVSYVPAALERGAQLVTGFTVDRVLVEGYRAAGVSGRTEHGRVTVRAKVTVLACGALLTPVLLQRNGLCSTSGELGKNLTIHPAVAALGLFDEAVNAERTVPQGYAIDEFAREGLYFEGSTLPLDLAGAAQPGHGPAWTSLMERHAHTLSFGFMVKDSGHGRVRAGRSGAPLITYRVNDTDVARLQRGCAILARVLFAAGADEVRLPVFGFERLRSPHDLPAFERATPAARHFDLSAYHPLGTARMGVDPLRSVVDATHEAHDLHNLFIADGSVMPGSPGVNPQLTIMAMSLRAAQYIERRLEQLTAGLNSIHMSAN